MPRAELDTVMLVEGPEADAVLLGFVREALARLGLTTTKSAVGATAAVVALGRETRPGQGSTLLQAWPAGRGPLLLLAAPEAGDESASRLAATGAVAIARGGLGGVAFLLAEAGLRSLPAALQARARGHTLAVDEAVTLDAVLVALLIGR